MPHFLTKLGVGSRLQKERRSTKSSGACWFCLFVWVRLYVLVNNFSIMSGPSHRFLGINTSTFWYVNVSCSRIEHVDLSEDRTPGLSLRSGITISLGHRASLGCMLVLVLRFAFIDNLFVGLAGKFIIRIRIVYW